jgi:hypothetical protein
MIKKEFLLKHCKTSKEGVIALLNTFVETAIKVHGCPIIVTCDDYPGEEATYSVEELLQPSFTAGPYPNKHSMDPEDTYKLCMYPWKGVPVERKVLNLAMAPPQEVVHEIVVQTPIVHKSGREYTIKTPVIVTSFEEKTVSLSQYIGLSICQTRTARGLTQNALSNLTGNKVSASSISQIETSDTNPILSSLEYIAEALGLHITDLFPPKN